MRAKSNSPSPAQRQVQAGTPKTKFLSVTMKTKIQNLLLVLALLAGVHQTLGQAIVINSISQNGV